MFGQAEGALRQRMIFDIYLLDTLTIAWYSADGRPNIERHEINQRKNDIVRAAYVQSIAKNGLCDGVRGEPWMVAPQGWTPGKKVASEWAPFRAITFGTPTTAVYDAAQMPDAAENKFIQGALERVCPELRWAGFRVVPAFPFCPRGTLFSNLVHFSNAFMSWAAFHLCCSRCSKWVWLRLAQSSRQFVVAPLPFPFLPCTSLFAPFRAIAVCSNGLLGWRTHSAKPGKGTRCARQGEREEGGQERTIALSGLPLCQL